MQVTIDIPETLYRELETQAIAGHQSVEDLLLKGANDLVSHEAAVLRQGKRVQLPLITSGEAGPLILSGTSLNDAFFMSDDEIDELTRQ